VEGVGEVVGEAALDLARDSVEVFDDDAGDGADGDLGGGCLPEAAIGELYGVEGLARRCFACHKLRIN